MAFSLQQKTTQEGAAWWSWEVWLEGDLNAVDRVKYTLHPTFSDPERTVSDRDSRFAIRSGGWGEFMIYAEVYLHGGEVVPLRHWLRFEGAAPAKGRALFLTGAPKDEVFTDSLHERLEQAGFKVFRTQDPQTFYPVTACIAVLSGAQSPWFEAELKFIQDRQKPLLVIALSEVQPPPCLASFRNPATSTGGVAVSWLLEVLDRSALSYALPALPANSGPFWNRRLALASADLELAAKSMLPLIAEGKVFATAVAISPYLAVAAAEGPVPTSLVLRTNAGDLAVTSEGQPTGFAVFRTATPLPAHIWPSVTAPADPVIAAIGTDAAGKLSLSLGWLTQPYPNLVHDAQNVPAGAAIVSLESGELLGIQIRSGGALPVSVLEYILPGGRLPGKPSGTLGLLEALAIPGIEPFLADPMIGVLAGVAVGPLPPASADDDLLERAKAEDYSDRKGYAPDFLGREVPLPTTKKQIDLLPYTNFSVALTPERRVALFTAVNINGKNLVELHRSADPWRLDPRVPAANQIGASFYEGTPLDRGHMVRRMDPIWGPDAAKAELDTFHYPNSCPQHKSLNRNTWNNLEDYIYLNLQRFDLKVTVFTGPVLSSDDPLFHGAQLPEEFWKVVVMRRDDGKLSATAYILSQEDLIKGLEFVYGEFKTYQVSLALIEKKTGLDFGDLRKFDPKAKAGTLESAALPSEVTGPQDLKLDLAIAPAPTVAAAPAPKAAWLDLAQGERDLKAALDTFDWPVAAELTGGLIARLARNPAGIADPFARRILVNLQRKRRFALMTRLADAFIQAGLDGPQIRRRYAQSLIDQGLFKAAELVLQAIIGDPSTPRVEQEEAEGLIGRLFKQIYVNANAPQNAKNAAHLQNALNSYWVQYALNPGQNYWHGINVVALLIRADRDGIALKSETDARQLATEILETLRELEKTSDTGELTQWQLATAIEAHLALAQFTEAINRAKTYADCKDADAFEIASTLRQLEEVWQLRDDAAPGDSILPILRAGLLTKEGSALNLSAASALANLQKVFGSDRAVSLVWFQNGLKCARSIARIETNDKGYGTGWLVDSQALGISGDPRILLLTNAHVIGPDSSDRYPEALRPEDATIHFQIQHEKMKPGKIVWHSPVNQCDATLLELPRVPAGTEALEVDASLIKVLATPQRLYIIGYPGGRDIEFSLQDNHLLAANDRLVHYRTPSEGGSSGSPVFGPVDWKVVALHHAGSRAMLRLDGQPGTYEANEGIAMAALRQAVK